MNDFKAHSGVTPAQMAFELDRLIPDIDERVPNLAALPTNFDTPRQNTTTRNIMIVVRAAIVSAPGQNGHIYLETSPDNVTYTMWDYIACRNESGNIAGVGNGHGLTAMVPKGYWYRLRTQTINGFAAPTYILDSPNWMTYALVA